jgi:hypothetical protein
MGHYHNPQIATNGLIFAIDAANPRCYPGSGNNLSNIVVGTGGTLVGPTYSSLNSGSFTFDGVDDYINIPYPAGLSTGSPITLCLWAKWTTVGTDTSTIQVLVDNNYQTSPGSIGFEIQDRPDLGKVLEWGAQPGAGITRCTSDFIVGDGTWRHITGTNDGSTSILYVDGVQSGLARTAAGIGSSQANINLGRWDFTNSRNMNGNISNFMIYNRALSAQEVLRHYNSSKSRYGY